jgi:hypothetical protein
MTGIKLQKIGVRILLWTILYSTSAIVLLGLFQFALAQNSKAIENFIGFGLFPISIVYFAYFVMKNGDRAEYLFYGRLLSENKLKKE